MVYGLERLMQIKNQTNKNAETNTQELTELYHEAVTRGRIDKMLKTCSDTKPNTMFPHKLNIKKKVMLC